MFMIHIKLSHIFQSQTTQGFKGLTVAATTINIGKTLCIMNSRVLSPADHLCFTFCLFFFIRNQMQHRCWPIIRVTPSNGFGVCSYLYHSIHNGIITSLASVEKYIVIQIRKPTEWQSVGLRKRGGETMIKSLTGSIFIQRLRCPLFD